MQKSQTFWKKKAEKKVEIIHKNDKNGQKINFLEKMKTFYYISWKKSAIISSRVKFALS